MPGKFSRRCTGTQSGDLAPSPLEIRGRTGSEACVNKVVTAGHRGRMAFRNWERDEWAQFFVSQHEYKPYRHRYRVSSTSKAAQTSFKCQPSTSKYPPIITPRRKNEGAPLAQKLQLCCTRRNPPKRARARPNHRQNAQIHKNHLIQRWRRVPVTSEHPFARRLNKQRLHPRKKCFQAWMPSPVLTDGQGRRSFWRASPAYSS